MTLLYFILIPLKCVNNLNTQKNSGIIFKNHINLSNIQRPLLQADSIKRCSFQRGSTVIFVIFIFISSLFYQKYHQTSNIIRTLVGNEIADHSDVVGISPVGVAPTTSSFST